MSGWEFVWAHTGFWIDIFVIIAAIILLAIIIYFIVRRHKLVKKEDELEQLLNEKYERERYKSFDDVVDEGDDFSDGGASY